MYRSQPNHLDEVFIERLRSSRHPNLALEALRRSIELQQTAPFAEDWAA
ncbi:MAG: hypothetical protein ACRDT0_10500 [Pseudonocardiaceae bacterium]